MRVRILSLLTFFVVSAASPNDVSEQTAPVALRHVLSTCLPCELTVAVTADASVKEHVRESLHSQCTGVPGKLQHFCHAVVDKAFAQAVAFLQQTVVASECTEFCGEKAEPLNGEILCRLGLFAFGQIEPLVATLKAKVDAVCRAEEDVEECLAGFAKWKPFIVNFLKRLALRILRELDPSTLCGFDVKKVPSAENALGMERLLAGNETAFCQLCDGFVDHVWFLLQSQTDQSPRVGACLVYNLCVEATGGHGDGVCPPDAQSPSEVACWRLAETTAHGRALARLDDVMDEELLPRACHLLDAACKAKETPFVLRK